MTSSFDNLPQGTDGPVGDGAAPTHGLLDEVGLVDGARLVARLEDVRATLSAVVEVLPRVPGDDLAGLAAAAAGVVTAARAAQAGVVLEAEERGVIAASDHPRVAGWVEASCREGGAPVTPGTGRALEQLARACRGLDVAPLREAVLTGRLPMERGAEVATTYRRLRARIEVDCWDVVLAELIAFVAGGARRADVAALEETLVGQYGRAGELEDERARLYERRELSGFRRTRAGMLQATLLLDPASEAVFSAAVHALSAPRPDPATGEADPRSAGVRRADAVLAMARHAANADPNVPGTGAGARVVVTMTWADLLTGLDRTERHRHGGHHGEAHDAGHGHDRGCHLPLPAPTVLPLPAPTVDSGKVPQGTSPCPGESPAHGESPRPGQSGTPRGRPREACPHEGGLNESGLNEAVPSESASKEVGSRPRRVGRTAFGQVLTATEVRLLACDAQIIPAVLGGAGELLELGRSRRLATPGILTALALRDQGCSYPGCSMPPGWSDAHHLRHWADGGATDVDNMTLLCRQHHTTVHRHGHLGELIDGQVVWRRRDGTPIGNHPRAA